jgi:hypothetical protein
LESTKSGQVHGDLCEDRATFDDVMQSCRTAKAAPVDCLVCVPHTLVPPGALPRRSDIGRALASWGYETWDGCDAEIRATDPQSAECVRIVQYDSARGLEGWAAFLIALDDLYAQRRKHPNLAAGETASPEDVAKRWLLMALTRAADVLVVSVRDWESETGRWIRAAAREMPKGVVEWRCPNPDVDESR